MSDDLAEALTSLSNVYATDPRDWSIHFRDAWTWGIVCGWDCEGQHDHADDEPCNAAMDEVAARHGWDADVVARLRRLRAAVRAAGSP